MRVLHVVGALNGWALHQRANALVRAMEGQVVGKVRCYRDLDNKSLVGIDFVHIHGLQLVKPARRQLGKFTCRWGFEVVSERSLTHLCSSETTQLLLHASFCWVKNHALSRVISRYVRCPIVFVPNGIDPAVFNPGPIKVGWVGNKRKTSMEYKGLPLILKAVTLLNTKLPNGCVFVEDPSKYPKVVSQGTLAQYYRGLDVFVSASLAEGSSNVVNEALACGVPVVTTRVGNAVLLQDVGLPVTIVERTAEAIAEGIEKAVQPKLAAGATMAEQFDWKSQQILVPYLEGYNGEVAISSQRD